MIPGAVVRSLERLAERFALPDDAPDRLARLLGLLACDPLAPTTVRDPARALDAHVADALVALDVEPVRGSRLIADLGSGAGFPGLVLAAALPQAEVALIESSRRKCEFLERAVEHVGLSNVAVVCRRAESWHAGRGTQDLVTARALAPLSVLVEYAAPLLRDGGALLAWKGRRDVREETDGAAAASQTGLEPSEIRPVEPWIGAEHLHLHLYLKVRATPNRFPRRPGIASKRPLRAST